MNTCASDQMWSQKSWKGKGGDRVAEEGRSSKLKAAWRKREDERESKRVSREGLGAVTGKGLCNTFCRAEKRRDAKGRQLSAPGSASAHISTGLSPRYLAI